jgi:hypothetical protein
LGLLQDDVTLGHIWKLFLQASGKAAQGDEGIANFVGYLSGNSTQGIKLFSLDNGFL